MPPKIPLDGADAPNLDLLKKDPMGEMFGPGSNVKLIGEPTDEVPDEVRALLEQHGMAKHNFQCMLKELPEGAQISGDADSGSTNAKYIKGWTRSIPSFDFIKNNYGPGFYIIAFSWRGQKADGTGTEAKHDEVTIEISPKALDEHKKFRLQSKIKNASDLTSQVRDELVEKNIEGSMVRAMTGDDDKAKVAPADAAKEYITSAMETVKMLGIPVGQTQAKAIEWDKLLPAVAPIVLAYLQHQSTMEQRRAEDFNKMLMLMVTQGQQSSHQMLEMFSRTQSGAGSGNQFIKEFTDMIKGAVDVKQLLNPPAETLGDKIFRVVESVAPQILTIASQAAQNQAALGKNPMVGMAKSYVDRNPDFQALRNNPVEMKKTIDRMDDYFGWRQTDAIIEVIGMPRPDNCPRDPMKKEPPELSGNGEAAQAEFNEEQPVQ
jgi:hypothetical protein